MPGLLSPPTAIPQDSEPPGRSGGMWGMQLHLRGPSQLQSPAGPGRKAQAVLSAHLLCPRAAPP